MNIFKSIRRFCQYFLNMGITESLIDLEKRRVRLLNLTSFVGFSIYFFFTCIYAEPPLEHYRKYRSSNQTSKKNAVANASINPNEIAAIKNSLLFLKDSMFSVFPLIIHPQQKLTAKGRTKIAVRPAGPNKLKVTERNTTNSVIFITGFRSPLQTKPSIMPKIVMTKR